MEGRRAETERMRNRADAKPTGAERSGGVKRRHGATSPLLKSLCIFLAVFLSVCLSGPFAILLATGLAKVEF